MDSGIEDGSGRAERELASARFTGSTGLKTAINFPALLQGVYIKKGDSNIGLRDSIIRELRNAFPDIKSDEVASGSKACSRPSSATESPQSEEI